MAECFLSGWAFPYCVTPCRVDADCIMGVIRHALIALAAAAWLVGLIDQIDSSTSLAAYLGISAALAATQLL